MGQSNTLFINENLRDLWSCQSVFNNFHLMTIWKALNSTTCLSYLKIFMRLIHLVLCNLSFPMCQIVNINPLSPLRQGYFPNPQILKGQLLLMPSFWTLELFLGLADFGVWISSFTRFNAHSIHAPKFAANGFGIGVLNLSFWNIY